MSKLAVLLVLVCALLACSLVADTRETLKSLGHINHGGRRETASHRKLRKLRHPNVEYYHEIQKTHDREVDRTARAVIDNPERAAARQRAIDDKVYAKTVSSATSLLNAHNNMKSVKAPPKLSLY